MDIKHRKAYAKISILGVKEDILLNDGMSLIVLLNREIPLALNKAPNRYEGFEIQISFEPINQHETTLEKASRDIMRDLAGLVEPSTPEDEALYAKGDPGDPKDSRYDPLYAEWRNCMSTKHRETKTPQDLMILRKHMDDNYKGTNHWDGIHRW